MRRRFNLTGEPALVDKDGKVLGVIVSMTVDLTDETDLLSSPMGTTGEGGEQERLDLGMGSAEGVEAPTTPAKPSDGPSVVEWGVWRRFLDAFPNHNFRNRDLTPPRLRTIRKAIKAVGGEENVRILHDAIYGLKSFRERKPGDIALSVIFETNMRDGKNLTEKIEWWASQATGGTFSGPSETDASINRRKIAVAEMFSYPDSTAHQERGHAAIEWLRAHGLEFVRDEQTGKLHWQAVQS